MQLKSLVGQRNFWNLWTDLPNKANSADAKGDPNTSQSFSDAIEALYVKIIVCIESQIGILL